MTLEDLQERAADLFTAHPHAWRSFVLATCTGNRRLLETCASPELLAEYDRVLLAATENRSSDTTELQRLRPLRDDYGALIGESTNRIAVDMVVELLVALAHDRSHLPSDWQTEHERDAIRESTEVLFAHVHWGDSAAIEVEWQRAQLAVRDGVDPHRAEHVEAAWQKHVSPDGQRALLTELPGWGYLLDPERDDVFGRCSQRLLTEVGSARLDPNRWLQRIFAMARARFERSKTEHDAWLIIYEEISAPLNTFGAAEFEHLTESWQTHPERTARDLMTAALFVYSVSGVPTEERLAKTATKLGRARELRNALATVDPNVPCVSWWAEFHDLSTVQSWLERVRSKLDELS